MTEQSLQLRQRRDITVTGQPIGRCHEIFLVVQILQAPESDDLQLSRGVQPDIDVLGEEGVDLGAGELLPT